MAGSASLTAPSPRVLKNAFFHSIFFCLPSACLPIELLEHDTVFKLYLSREGFCWLPLSRSDDLLVCYSKGTAVRISIVSYFMNPQETDHSIPCIFRQGYHRKGSESVCL